MWLYLIMFKSIIKLVKKLFFYFLLFTGMILSTSHLGDNYMGISDEEGYLLAIGICCLTAFIIEYLIPRIKS
jgi:hypothetical protein